MASLSRHSLTKTGTGTQILTSTSNTYTGATIISAGTLLVTGALSNSAVDVGALGTIGGSGALIMGLNIAAGGNLDLTGATLGVNSTNILSITGGSLTLGALTFRHVRKIFRGGNKTPATCSSGGDGQVPSF